MRLRVLPALGAVRLAELRRSDLQEFADRLLAEGLSPPTIQDDAAPAAGDLPPRAEPRASSRSTPAPASSSRPSGAGGSATPRPTEAEALIAAVPERDRAIWATAMYAGLRRGELRALRVEDVDLAAGVIHVERGWDPAEGEIELKSNAGRRKVPITAVLRDYLAEHLARVDRAPAELDLRQHAADPVHAEHAPAPGRRGVEGAGSSGSRRTSAATPSPR